MGIFEVILAAIGANLPDKPPAAPAAAGIPTALDSPPGQQIAAANNTIPAAPAPAPVEAAAPTLLADFADQLTALRQTVNDGAPIDPAAEKHLKETLDALAAALGIELPQVEPPITTAAVTPVEALDPLATIEAAATPPAIAATDVETDAPVTAPGAILPAIGGALIVATETDVTPTAARPEAAERPIAPEVPPVVKELARKIGEVAAVLVSRAPELARKLEALAGKLTSGEIDAKAFKSLGIAPPVEGDVPDTEVARAIERLLTPGGEPQPRAAPAPFMAANLALPDLGTPKARAEAPIDAKPVPPVAEAGPLPEVEADIELASTASRPPERTDRPEAPAQQRPAFHTAFQASLAADAPTPQTTVSAPATIVVGSAVAADARAMHAAYRAPMQQVNIPQMAIEIVRQVEAGASRFQIRLDPPELGRVDVKLDVDKAGNVSARMTVERAETLDLMQRDQRSLEKALAQAGLDSSKTSLEFSLRQNPSGNGQQQPDGGNGQPSFPRFGTAEADDTVPGPHVTAYRGYASASGVNLFV